MIELTSAERLVLSVKEQGGSLDDIAEILARLGGPGKRKKLSKEGVRRILLKARKKWKTEVAVEEFLQKGKRVEAARLDLVANIPGLRRALARWGPLSLNTDNEEEVFRRFLALNEVEARRLAFIGRKKVKRIQEVLLEYNLHLGMTEEELTSKELRR